MKGGKKLTRRCHRILLAATITAAAALDLAGLEPFTAAVIAFAGYSLAGYVIGTRGGGCVRSTCSEPAPDARPAPHQSTHSGG